LIEERFLISGLFLPLDVRPVATCHPCDHPLRPAIVDIVGDLLTDLRRLKQVLSGSNILSLACASSRYFRRLFHGDSRILHRTSSRTELTICSLSATPLVGTPAWLSASAAGRLRWDLHLGVSEPSQWNVAFRPPASGSSFANYRSVRTFDPLDDPNMGAVRNPRLPCTAQSSWAAAMKRLPRNSSSL